MNIDEMWKDYKLLYPMEAKGQFGVEVGEEGIWGIVNLGK